ncbi:MAG: ABC transporter permease [Actinomycetota bacterium]|nr:ABC transporter permease [Actinomycetota bacterium]
MATQVDTKPTAAPAPGPHKERRKKRAWILPTYTGVIIAYLFIPILVMIMFGFNEPAGRYNFQWEGFTTKWYNPDRLLEFEDLNEAVKNSLLIGVISTFVSTVFGSLIALALTRHRFRGRAGLNLGLFLPMASPEVVLGVALLALFVSLNVNTGFVTIVISHVMFCISYVVVTVKARTSGFDRSLEDAAKDLGADPWTTFWTVTFPLIFPGILAASLLAFALSVDDYVITSFNAGGTVTIPLWVYGASRIGVPPQVNVMGTLLFGIGVIYVLVSIFRGRRQGAVPSPPVKAG